MLGLFAVLYPDEVLLRTALRGAVAYQLSWFDAHLWAYAEHFWTSGSSLVYITDIIGSTVSAGFPLRPCREDIPGLPYQSAFSGPRLALLAIRRPPPWHRDCVHGNCVCGHA